MATKDELGRAGEERAARHLAAQGLTVVDRNWRIAEGELDIVAITDADVVVVEVKTRSRDTFGDPLDAVDARKRTRLRMLARRWCRRHPEIARGRGLRIDVIGITGSCPARGSLRHVRDVS